MKKQTLHFVIGDIHGCYDELIDLEKRIVNIAKRHNAHYKIISVGDLVDRGPKSKEVVEHFIQGTHKGTHQAVMGNHEILLIEALMFENSSWYKRTGIKFPNYLLNIKERYKKTRWSKGVSQTEYKVLLKAFWLSQGGVETFSSYGINHTKSKTWKIPKEHLEYLTSLPLYLEFKSFIVSHALLVKEDLLKVKKGDNSKGFKESAGSLFWNREMKKVSPYKSKLLISGHTPFKNVKRNKEKKVVQVDTLCFGGGKLSAFCPELNNSFSVKALKKYY